MIDGYMTVKEIADKWGITSRRVQIMCSTGKIVGAAKLGREWAIPEKTEKPTDGRVTSGEYKDWRKS